MKFFNMIGKWITLIIFIVTTYLVVAKLNIITLDVWLESWNDKLKHILAFTLLAFGLTHYWRIRWYFTLVILLMYGIGIEVVQYFIPNRTTSMWDILADILGIFLGILGYIFIGFISKNAKN